jgi:hypothetical protein
MGFVGRLEVIAQRAGLCGGGVFYKRPLDLPHEFTS